MTKARLAAGQAAIRRVAAVQTQSVIVRRAPAIRKSVEPMLQEETAAARVMGGADSW